MLKKVTANNRDNHSAIIVHVLNVQDMDEESALTIEREEKNLAVERKTFQFCCRTCDGDDICFDSGLYIVSDHSGER